MAFDQLALEDARLLKRSIFNGLHPSKAPGHPWPRTDGPANQRSLRPRRGGATPRLGDSAPVTRAAARGRRSIRSRNALPGYSDPLVPDPDRVTGAPFRSPLYLPRRRAARAWTSRGLVKKSLNAGIDLANGTISLETDIYQYSLPFELIFRILRAQQSVSACSLHRDRRCGSSWPGP